MEATATEPTPPTGEQVAALTKAIEKLTEALNKVAPFLADLADSAFHR